MLTLQAKEKEIENLTPEEEFIRGTVGAECQIDLDDFWQGYENTVVFKRENDCTVYNVAIDSLSNRVEIPYTILAESGSFKVGLFGVKPDEVLPTLWSDYIKVRYGTDTHGTTPPKYEPNEIDQLRLSKQDKLTAGDGITIDENNVISATGGGGSGGTTDYKLLKNKPQINGVELLGNKSLTDLGIDIPTKTSELENDSGFIDDTAFENYYTKTELDDKIDKRLPKLTAWSSQFKRVLSLKENIEANIDGTMLDNAYEYINVNKVGSKYAQGEAANTLALRDNNGNLWTYAPVDEEDCVNKKYVDEKIAEIPSGGGGETWEVISDTTTEFDTPVSQIVINQDTNGNSFSLKKMRVFIDFTVAESYTGIARVLTTSPDPSNLMYIVSQSFSAATVYGYFIDSEVLPMVNNRCQIISHFNETRMLENGNNFDFEYNIGAVDYAIRTEKMTVTKLGYNVSSISNFDFRLGSAGKINKARILIFGVRA